MKMPRSPKKSSKSWLKRLGSDTFHDIRRAIVAGVYDGIRGGIVQSFDKTRFQSIGVSEIRLAILTKPFLQQRQIPQLKTPAQCPTAGPAPGPHQMHW